MRIFLENTLHYVKWKQMQMHNLHWFSFNIGSTTTNTSLVTKAIIVVFQSWCTTHTCWPFISKAKCYTPKLKSGIHFIWMFSYLHLGNDLKAQKGFAIKLEDCSQYMLYKSPWQTLIVVIRSLWLETWLNFIESQHKNNNFVLMALDNPD